MRYSNLTRELNMRASIYSFLAQAFYEPDHALMEFLQDHEAWQGVVAAAEKLYGVKSETLANLPDTLDLDNNLEPGEPRAALRDLRVEYNRLFVGPSAPPCPPYESVYTPDRPLEQAGTMLGPATSAMEEILRSEKLAITLNYAEYADHIAIELEMMYYLLKKAVRLAQLGKINHRAAKTFLMERILLWMPAFGEKLATEARHPFYTSLGNILNLLIVSEGARYSSEGAVML